MQNQIGYVIWGIKHEFSKKIFSNNIDIRLINSLFDVRDLFQGKAQQSFSIEKVFDYTLVTLYDPSTIDSSGARQAYIAFTISIQNDYLPNGNILEWLSELKTEYDKKGNYAMNENFNAIINKFSVVSNPKNSSRQLEKKNIGFYDFSNTSEILEIFSDLDTMGFPKIYFFNPHNSYVDNISNFEKVTSLERKYSVQIINFIPQEHQLFINDNLIKPHQTSSGRVEINDLRKKDNIKVKRGISQAIVDLYAKDQHEIILPKIEQPASNTFTINKLDKEKYNVKVNGVEVNTAYTLNGVLKINISTPHVIVEIIDKKTYKSIQTHDTRILKTFELTVSTDNDDSSNGKNTKERNRDGNNPNEDNTSIGQKSKRGLVITLISLVLLVGIGITGWQLGWFGPETIANATTNEATKNVTTIPDSVKINPAISEDYPGYTLKENFSIFKTEEGYTEKNKDKYRLKNGKLEIKYFLTDNKSYGEWKEMKPEMVKVILQNYFNKSVEKQTVEDSNTTTTTTTTTIESNQAETTNQETAKDKKCKEINNFLTEAQKTINKAGSNKSTERKKWIKDVETKFTDKDCLNCSNVKSVQDIKDKIEDMQ